MNIKKKFLFSDISLIFFFSFTFFTTALTEQNNVRLLIPCIEKASDAQLEEPYCFPVAYLGALYDATVTPSFGGRAVLEDSVFRSSYYLIVSDKVVFNFSKNGSLKGYSLSPEAASQAQFFKINLILFVNDKDVTTYNWEIIKLEHSDMAIPANAIIFHCDPSLVTVTAFDESFAGIYPPFGSGSLILPSIEIAPHQKSKYAERASVRIHAGYGHKKVVTIC
jgi:hypothetical protein